MYLDITYYKNTIRENKDVQKDIESVVVVIVISIKLRIVKYMYTVKNGNLE